MQVQAVPVQVQVQVVPVQLVQVQVQAVQVQERVLALDQQGLVSAPPLAVVVEMEMASAVMEVTGTTAGLVRVLATEPQRLDLGAARRRSATMQVSLACF